MRSKRKGTGALAGALAVVAALAVASLAFATVTIYKESFARKGSVRALSQFSGGKRCAIAHHRKSRTLRVRVLRRDVLCAYRPPVVADSAVPDHEINVAVRLAKKQTPRAVRRKSYVAVLLRVDKNSHYQFRVFPHSGRYELLRVPNGGGGGFPVTGKSDAVKGIDATNKVRLRAFGARIEAFVNGTRLADVTDADPGQVDGRRIAFGVGSLKDVKGGPLAVFKSVNVRVPDP
jgi:hypothetical protein